MKHLRSTSNDNYKHCMYWLLKTEVAQDKSMNVESKKDQEVNTDTSLKHSNFIQLTEENKRNREI